MVERTQGDAEINPFLRKGRIVDYHDLKMQSPEHIEVTGRDMDRAMDMLEKIYLLPIGTRLLVVSYITRIGLRAVLDFKKEVFAKIAVHAHMYFR